jgi:hypothetical protein
MMLMVVFHGLLHAAVGAVGDGAPDDSADNRRARIVATIVIVGWIRVTVTAVNELKVASR